MPALQNSNLRCLNLTVRDRYHEQTSVSKAADPFGRMVEHGMTRDRPYGSLSFLAGDGVPHGECTDPAPGLSNLPPSGPPSLTNPTPPSGGARGGTGVGGQGGGRRPASFVGEFGMNGSALGCMYCAARGEILRPVPDTPQRKLSAGAPPSIKNESVGSKDDQIPL